MNNDINGYLLEFSEADRMILSSYCALCECLSLYLGGGYEIVVHGLGADNNFILNIMNGHHSGRARGDSIDGSPEVIVEALYTLLERGERPVTVYFNEGRNGVVFKSATIGIVGSGQKIIGLLCLNFSLNSTVLDFIERFSLPKNVIARKEALSPYDEKGYEEIISDIVKEAVREVADNPEIPLKYKNKEIIRRLCESGIFKIKSSVSVCAEMLGISITTIYMHIRSFETSQD